MEVEDMAQLTLTPVSVLDGCQAPLFFGDQQAVHGLLGKLEVTGLYGIHDAGVLSVLARGVADSLVEHLTQGSQRRKIPNLRSQQLVAQAFCKGNMKVGQKELLFVDITRIDD